MMVRMFHIQCDIGKPGCEDSLGDEWYGFMAKTRAKEAGWVRRQVNGEKIDICPNCQGK